MYLAGGMTSGHGNCIKEDVLHGLVEQEILIAGDIYIYIYILDLDTASLDWPRRPYPHRRDR